MTPTRITEGHLVRHFNGVKAARDGAILDIAQDHALHHLHEEGLFHEGLVFKGGTALRKFRAGSAGRFSTDLDFACPDDDLVLNVLGAFDGAEVDGFTFRLTNHGDDGRRADLVIESPFGTPTLGAKVELARHALSLAPQMLEPLSLPIHSRYGFKMPALPVVRVEEAIAEKLARYRRVALARDLYDLYWYGDGALDEPLVRRLWVLKVYRDINSDGRGTAPIRPEDVLAAWSVADFAPEDIGYLTKPVKLGEWISRVKSRYGFLDALTSDEVKWCGVNARHAYEVEQALLTIGTG